MGFFGVGFLGECTQKTHRDFWVHTRVSEPWQKWHLLFVRVVSKALMTVVCDVWYSKLSLESLSEAQCLSRNVLRVTSCQSPLNFDKDAVLLHQFSSALNLQLSDAAKQPIVSWTFVLTVCICTLCVSVRSITCNSVRSLVSTVMLTLWPENPVLTSSGLWLAEYGLLSSSAYHRLLGGSVGRALARDWKVASSTPGLSATE